MNNCGIEQLKVGDMASCVRNAPLAPLLPPCCCRCSRFAVSKACALLLECCVIRTNFHFAHQRIDKESCAKINSFVVILQRICAREFVLRGKRELRVDLHERRAMLRAYLHSSGVAASPGEHETAQRAPVISPRLNRTKLQRFR